MSRLARTISESGVYHILFSECHLGTYIFWHHFINDNKQHREPSPVLLMINYCKDKMQNFVAELSNFAAFISLTFFNYIEGMISLSYIHQKEAITYAPDNYEYKRIFFEIYCNHPDVDHDTVFESTILKDEKIIGR